MLVTANPAAGHCGRYQVGSCFDAVGQYRIIRAAKRLDALHRDRAARPLDLRAEPREKLGEIDDLRFPGCVLQHGFAVSKHGGHQQVFGARHRDRVENDVRTLEALRSRLDEA